jgi:DNA repair photolyase
MSTPCIPPIGVRGRGARSNATGRFESLVQEAFDDGWTDADAAPPKLRTTLSIDRARTILNRNDSPDIGFDRSINPYRGCEHGCIYCYARPTHAYLGLSPGLDFESQLYVKPEAAKLLEAELSRPRYVCERIQLGANTDPYQPIERQLRVTRGVLEVLERFRHPVGITTKNAMITRDADVLGRMGRAGLACAAMSITTLDRKLARAMEPRASTPQRRLEAVRAMTDAGLPMMVSVAPIIPGLNDHEIEAILERGAEAGARHAHFTVLRLPLEIKDLFREWLETERPQRAARVMSLVRQMRGGRDYDSQWSLRMKGEGPIADLIAARFKAACKRFGLNGDRLSLDTAQFRPPPKAGDQLPLF